MLATRGTVPPATAAVATLLAAGVVLRRRRSGRWAAGAAAERWTGSALEELAAEGFDVIHDVRLPGRRSNVDHVVTGRPGVIVVETKHWREPVRVAPRGLRRGRRRETDAVTQVVEQLAAVRAAVGPGVPVSGFLCIHGGQVRTPWWWPRPVVRGIRVGGTDAMLRWMRRRPNRLRRRDAARVSSVLRGTFAGAP